MADPIVRRQRFRRLEELLGAPVDDHLTDEHFQRLVDAKIAESDDLDFKQALYEKNSKGRAQLAKDVAALANHIGGVIVLGVADAKGVASKVMPLLGADDAEIRRMRSLIANRVHPFLTVPIIRCRSAADPQRGFLLLLVPRSSLAPHTVSDPSDTALRFWVRYGSQTLPMGETMVADRYRDRFEQARGRLQRLEDMMAEGISRLDRAQPWVVTAAVPEMPGALPLDSASWRRLRDWARAMPPLRLGDSYLLSTDTMRVGVRRIFLDDLSRHETQLVREATAELHTDGAIFLAAPLSIRNMDGGFRNPTACTMLPLSTTSQRRFALPPSIPRRTLTQVARLSLNRRFSSHARGTDLRPTRSSSTASARSVAASSSFNLPAGHCSQCPLLGIPWT